MSETQNAKGEQLMMEAEAMLNKGTGACCGRGRARVDEACGLYVNAANAFKMAKEWHKAGTAFSEAASHELAAERKTEAGMHYVEAAKCFKKVSPADCEQCLTKASEIYDEVGRGKTAAKQHLTLAELHEEQGNLRKAVDEYQRAADMFMGEELASSTTKCKLSVGLHSATLGDYERAEAIFEELGNESLNNKLLKYTNTEHYARAGLCRLAAKPQDGDGLRRKLEEWRDTSPAFADSRECSWLAMMSEAAQKEDLDGFNEAVRNYESITRLTDWQSELIKKIRRQIGPDLR